MSRAADVLVDCLEAVGCTAAFGAPDEASLAAAAAQIAAAERPFVIAGGAGWSTDASDTLAEFAASAELPVSATWRRQDVMDNESAHYAGHVGLGIDPALAALVREADCLIAVVARSSRGRSAGAPPRATLWSTRRKGSAG